MSGLPRLLAGLGLAILLTLLPSGPTDAATRLYRLDGPGSRVGFEVAFGGGDIKGNIPVSAAELKLDFSNVTDSKISATLDVGHASASFPFAAQAMKSEGVLDAEHHPSIAFRSTRIRHRGDNFVVEGQLTLRGVTRPVSLDAILGRTAGTDPANPDQMVVRLTGAISRSAFGASGWSENVGDQVKLDILALITRVD